MKKLLSIFALALCALASGAQVEASAQTAEAAAAAPKQSSAVTANRVIGEVVGIDGVAKQLTVKTDSGALVTVLLDEKSVYLRTRPGATNLEGAASITLADIRIGDRVFARGRVAEDQKSVRTQQLIVMTKADIAEKHERDREEWRRRGIVGTVSAINPETKEITLQVRSFVGAPQPVVVSAGEGKVKFRRYAPDSVRFSDAKPGSLAEIKVGDQLRAKGERSADGARFAPEEIVSGTFRSIRGSVVAVDAQANEIKVKDQDGQTVTVRISKDSTVKRIPAEFAQRMAMRAQRGAGGGAEGGEGAERPQGERAGGRDAASGAGAGGGARRRAEGAGGDEAAGGMGRRRMGGAPDVQEMLERMPAITVAELKPGEMVVVSSTAGADPTRATAIALVSGVEALLQMQQQRRGGGAQGASLGLPGGALDLGIGLP
ncbi:MAG TPA: hypothetical protein VGB73_01180 [Pyrinomonadaceae bacterium]|jgi:hypothetical protein